MDKDSTDNSTSPKRIDYPDEPTPTSNEKSSFNYWESKRSVKKLKLDAGDEPFKISNIRLEKYTTASLIVRATFVGIPGATKKGDKVVSLYGMDDTGEICIVGYRGNAEKISNTVEFNKCYKITGFYATKDQEIDGVSATRTGHMFKLTLLECAEIAPVDATVPEIKLNFNPIIGLNEKTVNSAMDALGIIIRIDEPNENSRDIFITDSVESTVRIKLYKTWINKVTDMDIKKSIVIRKGIVKESSIGVKYIWADWNTLVWVDPQIPVAVNLLNWFQNEDTLDQHQPE